MDPSTFRLFASSSSQAGFALGQFVGGGYFAGYISHTANGIATHALIVAPAATGASGNGYTLTTEYTAKTTNTITATSVSMFDGRANTDAQIALGISGFPAAQFCVSLNINGYSDWYLPAYLELEIAYFNLKPGADSNNTSYGVNSYAIPVRNSNYTASAPAQTGVSAFIEGGPEAFQKSNHWTSSHLDGSANTRYVGFLSGFNAFGSSSGNLNEVRAFRRIAL